MRHVELGRRFLEVERDWRAKHPETRTVGVEVSVQGWLDLETGELARERSAGALAFSGTIDRVDFDSHGFAAVLDYKSSASPDSVSNFDSWIKKDRLQLLLYAQALERGLTTLAPRPVASAAFYVGRSLNRDTGFKLVDVDQGLYEFADRKKNQATSQQKAEMFEALAHRTREAMSGVLAGRFQPIPKETKTCDRCEWSDACRAPHLNI
jgi:ATP-dependent helicase/DNAse subunit B